MAREAVGTGHHATRELIEETVRLAIESVVNGWGGPFGAVIVRDGEIVARGQNRVLLTGDVTAHAEIEAIRRACEALNPAHLALVPRPDGSPDPVPARARMLLGHELYTTGAPCPMCMGAITWARLDRVYYSCDLEATRAIGFDDAFQYEDLARPPRERRIPVEHVHPELGAKAYEAWLAKADRHPY